MIRPWESQEPTVPTQQGGVGASMLPAQEPAQQEPTPRPRSIREFTPMERIGLSTPEYARNYALKELRDNQNLYATEVADYWFRSAGVLEREFDPEDAGAMRWVFDAYRAGGEQWADAEQWLEADSRADRFRSNLQDYEAFRDNLLRNPMRSYTAIPDEQFSRDMMEIISHPLGMDAIDVVSKMTSDPSFRGLAEHLENTVNMGIAAHLMEGRGVGAPMSEGQSPLTLSAFALEGVEYGKRHEAARRAEQSSQSWDALDMRGHYSPRRVPDRPVDWFQQFSLAWSQMLATEAAGMGIDYEAASEMPATVGDAAKLFERSLEVARSVDTRRIEAGAGQAFLQGSMSTKEAFINFARLFHAAQEALPEDEALKLGEVVDVYRRLATGELGDDQDMPGGTSVVLGFLHLLGRPDMAVSEATVGGAKKASPRFLRFDDGFVTDDPMEAAKHYIRLREDGALDEADPVEAFQAEAQRWRALAPGSGEVWDESTGEFSRVSGLDYGGALGEGIQWMGAGFALGVDTLTGGVPDPFAQRPPNGYARPVAFFDTTQARAEGGGASRAWGGLVSGEGQYMTEAVLEQAAQATAMGWGHKLGAGVGGFTMEVLLSPWNFVSAGAVPAARVAMRQKQLAGAVMAAGEASSEFQAIIRESLESTGKMSKGERKAAEMGGRSGGVPRFLDGVEMGEDWAAARNLIARRFGSGSKNYGAGAEDIADMWLTRVRDNPGSLDDIVKGIVDDGQFLDDFARALGESGIPDARVAAATGNRDALRGVARDIFHGSVGDMKLVTEQAALNYGGRSFWNSGRRAAMMENARGIFVGSGSIMGRKLGLDFTAARRFMGPKASQAMRWLGSEEGGRIRRSVSKLMTRFGISTRNAAYFLASGFNSNFWSVDGLAASGGVLPPGAISHVERIPWRMRRMFEDKYRRRMAAATQTIEAEAGWALSRQGADGAQKLLNEQERILVSVALEIGEDSPVATARLLDVGKQAILRDHIPTHMLTEEALSEVWENVENVRALFAGYADEMRAMGMVPEDILLSPDYLTRFYRNAEARKTMMAGLASPLPARRAAGGVEGPRVSPGHHTKERVGPPDLFEAIRLGLDPEMDIAHLLLYRARSHYEAHTKLSFLGAVSAAYGRPMMRGREAVLSALDDASAARWAREDSLARSAKEVKDYGQAMKRLGGLLGSKSYLRRRRNVSVLARAIGVNLRTLADETALVQALPQSEKFLRLASSGRRNVLDGFLPESLREALRAESREILALRSKREKALNRLREVTPGIPLWSNVAEEDAGAIAKALRDEADKRHSAATMEVRRDSRNLRPSKEVGVEGPRLDELQKTLQAKKKSLSFFVGEGKVVSEELSALKDEMADLLRERSSISARWDKSKQRLVAYGYDGNGLAQANYLEDVNFNGKPPRNDREAHARLKEFYRYKEAQSFYVRNHRQQLSVRASVFEMEDKANKALRDIEQARRSVAASDAAIKDARAGAAERRKARIGTKKQLKKAERKVDKAVDDFLRHHDAALEAEGRMASMAGANSFRENARLIRQYMDRTALYERMIGARIASLARRFNVNRATVRARAQAAEELPEAVPSRSSALDEVARLGERSRAARQGYASKAEKLTVRSDPYGGVNESSLPRYQRAEDTLRAFDITGEEQSALLWSLFGARNLTDVPVSELELASDRMLVKMGRFLAHPAEPDGRLLAHVRDGADGPMRRLEEALSLPSDRAWERRSEALDDALASLWGRVEAGDEGALATLGRISPRDISELYTPNSVSDVLDNATTHGVLPRNQFLRVGVPAEHAAASPVMRRMSNTLLPAELGLAYKAMVGESLLGGGATADFVFSQWVSKAFMGVAASLRAVTRPWKGAVTGAAGDFRFGRRNGWFDGARTWVSLGLWGGLSPDVQRAFRADMDRVGGALHTAAGPVQAGVFRETLHRQGITTVAARTDDVENFAKTVSQRSEDARRGRSEKYLEANLRESTRGRSTGVAPGGRLGAAVGAAAGEALGLGAYAGAQMGHQAGAALHMSRHPSPHTSGAMPTIMDWVAPISPAAAERLENYHRAFAYWTFVKSGMSPQDAVRKMNDLLRDYSNLTRGEHGMIGAIPAFYNFTKQNAKSQFLRLLDSPSRATFFMRLFRAANADQEVDLPPYFNNLNSLVKNGKVWFVSDELEAMVSWSQPAVDLLWNQSLKKAAKSARSIAAPLVGEVLDSYIKDDRPLAVPPAIARRMYDRFGPFHGPHASVWRDKDGVVRGEWEPAGRAILVLSGMAVGATNAGRIENHLDMGDIGSMFLEVAGFGRVYDARSPFEGDYIRLLESERWAVDRLEELRVNSYENIGAYLDDATGEEHLLWNELLNSMEVQGKEVSEMFGHLRRLEGRGSRERDTRAVSNPDPATVTIEQQ